MKTKSISQYIIQTIRRKRSSQQVKLLLVSLLFAIEAITVVVVQAAEAEHLGVASCASSTCHGSSVAFADSNVQQNEFRIWNEQDPHARAYKTLLSPESISIARKLGLKSAHEADSCLGCHADNVAKNLRGKEFKIADGVACETCHGGAQDYIETHTRNTHEQNLRAGLYPTEKPTDRATLCVSCHVGNQSDRKITHTIMGAGHPRLSFELNTFSSIQPAHYLVDEDYLARKGDHSELQFWAIGQLMAAEQLLSNVRAFPRSGLFPELSHMDCLGCHQSMSKITWAANPLTKLPAGALRYNDAHLLMSYQLAMAATPDLAAEFLKDIQLFLNSTVANKKSPRSLTTLQQSLKGVRTSLEQNPITEQQGRTILRALIKAGLASSHQGYASAEQSAMAINSLVRVLNRSDVEGAKKAQLLKGLQTMFDGVNDSENYRATVFLAGLEQIKTALAN